MKRIVLSLLLIFVMAGFVLAQGNAGAQNKNGNGAYYNCPYPDCPLCTNGVYGPRAGKGGKGMAMGEPVIVTADQAKNADSFFFHVDPWGRVGGPISYTKTK